MMELIPVPDSSLARSAAALAGKTEPPFLVRHSERTYQFGAQLLSLAQRDFDAEVLYVACMLHDIALGTEFDDGTTPFNFKGGGVAARYVLDADRSGEDASLVFDAIALHMELSTAEDTRPEVAGVHLGAAADVVGLRLDQFVPEWLEAVIAASPRVGMKQSFIDVIGAEARTKPYSAAAALIENLGFLELISGAPFDE
jgi:HD domain